MNIKHVEVEDPPSVKLGAVKAGEIVVPANVGFRQAIENEEVFMVVTYGGAVKPPNTILLARLASGEIGEWSGCQPVHILDNSVYLKLRE